MQDLVLLWTVCGICIEQRVYLFLMLGAGDGTFLESTSTIFQALVSLFNVELILKLRVGGFSTRDISLY